MRAARAGSCVTRGIRSVPEDPFPGSRPSGGPEACRVPGRRDELESRLGELLGEAASYTRRSPAGSAAGAWWERTPAELPGPGSASWQLRPEGEDHDAEPAERWRRAAVLFLFCVPEEPEPSSTGPGAEPYLLLTERSAGLAKHPGQVSLPGGAQEDSDAGPAACALREAQEEIGLDLARVRLLGQLPPAPVPVSGFMVTPVVATTADPGPLAPEPGEVEEVLRVPVSALVAPENRRTAVISWRGALRRSPAFLTGGALVWGFTGILLDRVLERLGWAVPWDEDLEIDPRQHQRLV